LRRELVAAARATLRFETHPGEQLQIDFGERRVEIDDVAVKVFFFVATLGYSRRLHVRAYGHERQDSWFDGLESAFRAFGGVPREVLLDNAKALILHHDPVSREVVLHPRRHAFARHWGFRRAYAEQHYLWRAVDQDGHVLDILVQSRRNAKAAQRFFRKLLKGLQYVPRMIITDKLKSYAAAKRKILPGVEHRQSRYLNNRAEFSGLM
jgi:IS1 family transposase